MTLTPRCPYQVTKEDVARARELVDAHCVQVALGDTEQKLFIDVLPQGEGHIDRAIIEERIPMYP